MGVHSDFDLAKQAMERHRRLVKRLCEQDDRRERRATIALFFLISYGVAAFLAFVVRSLLFGSF